MEASGAVVSGISSCVVMCNPWGWGFNPGSGNFFFAFFDGPLWLTAWFLVIVGAQLRFLDPELCQKSISMKLFVCKFAIFCCKTAMVAGPPNKFAQIWTFISISTIECQLHSFGANWQRRVFLMHRCTPKVVVYIVRTGLSGMAKLHQETPFEQATRQQ